MKTIDIYTTPQCGFCKTLKEKLDEKKISYTSHDVTTNEQDLIDMRKMSDGAISVPVTVLNRGTKEQKVFVGYPEAAHELGLENEMRVDSHTKKTATLTCPNCESKQEGEIPTTACVPFYVCEGCGDTIKAQGDDCCVFCSYADKKCPLKKDEGSCSDGACRLT